MATIVEFISRKYNIENINELTITKLVEIQHEYLIRQIETKPLHSFLFQCLKDTEVNVNESAGWLVHGNNSARTEGMCCLLQDQNLFFDNGENKCNSAKKIVDHLATRCGRMLNSSYLRRHNEIVKCLHLHLCRQYGIRKTKKLKTHSVQSVVANEVVEIRVDTTITDTAVSNGKPDIFVHDKVRNTITLIEVGITSQNCLKQVEVEKFHKYDLLANELGAIHLAKVKIIPVVLT
ncbi:uncharacterized protein LOC115230638 [Octopus sinensis]|uniref:Uncharacterized protein LOC115230638 n=1 Tax=Octopus sinensis TaxID=2607531 RepID=A0A6P7TXY6_9MOLL|nr:uncharacterized protein LOC115230638 [Octopus sinensis]